MNSFDKAVKMANLKSWYPNTCLFNILYDEILLCICICFEKIFWCNRAVNWTRLSFKMNFFYFWNSNWLPNMVIHTYGADVFLNINKWACHFKGNKWLYFVTNDKIQGFKLTIRILESLFLPQWVNLTVSQYIRAFIISDINVTFYCMMKHVNIRKICLTQWMNIFQMMKALCYKNQAW